MLINPGPQGHPPPPMAYHPQAPIMATGMPGGHGPPPLLLPGGAGPPMLPTFQQLPDGSLIPIGQAPPPMPAGAPVVNYVMTPQGLVPAAAAPPTNFQQVTTYLVLTYLVLILWKGENLRLHKDNFTCNSNY